MRLLLFTSSLILAIALKLLQFQPGELQDLKFQPDTLKFHETCMKFHEISCSDVEPSYFEPFDKVLNCSLIALSDSMNALSYRLQVPAIWIYRTCIAESGLNPRVQNTLGATGLIQFMPLTAKSLGTTTQELRKMSAIDQLLFVEKFYKPAMNQIYSYAEFRLYAFFPAALRWENDRVLQTPGLSAKEVALRNPLHDLNRDMQITKLEYLKSVGYVLTSRN